VAEKRASHHSGHMWKAQRRRRKPREGARGALGAQGGHSGAHKLIVYRSFRSELSTLNNLLKDAPRVTLEESNCRVL
jgi:hypothetical protein